MNIKTLLQMIQSANVNFLVGSGTSVPYLSALGRVEIWLTELSKLQDYTSEDDILAKNFIQVSILQQYVDEVMYPNCESFYLKTSKITDEFNKVLEKYKSFLSIWHSIMSKRGVKLISKQINLFTTNIDLFFERAAEALEVEMNDGFNGGLNPSFSVNNFHKSISKSSMFYHHNSEVPVFNLQKIHGSIHWKRDFDDTTIKKDTLLTVLKGVKERLDNIRLINLYDLNKFKGDAEAQVKAALQKAKDEIDDIKKEKIAIEVFLDYYDKLVMINPTKAKFSTSVKELHFYELMRLMSNSLERENSLLFVMGFSFADEHLAEIIMRCLNANPTLLMVVFVFNGDDKKIFANRLNKAVNNSNVVLLTPEIFSEANKEEDDNFKPEGESEESGISIKNFDLKSIIRVFANVDSRIPIKLNYGTK